MSPDPITSVDALSGGDPWPQILEMNEALTLGAVRQHELREAAEELTVRLRQEVAQRRQAEKDLRASEERFRALFEAAPMAVFACDRDGLIEHYNAGAAELWGREPTGGDERYCGAVQLWRTEGTLLPHAESPIVEVLRTGLPTLNVEFLIERPDGSRSPVLANFAALKNGDGEITGAIASLVDLTERKKLEQQSFRAQRMESIGTLAGGIAHNLNNSLGPILMSIALLKMKFPDPASQELLAIVEASAERGAEMVRQVLTFARGVEGQRVEVSVQHLVAEIEKIVDETFLGDIRIQTHLSPNLWSVLGDSTQLYQVLLNLCLNARDAMPHGGLLMISAENRQIEATEPGLAQNPAARPGPYVVLEVRDGGTGMPARIVEKIFDPFFTTKEVGQGSGLGLSSARAIVRGHAGFLQVTSEPGQGTTFQVFLPAQCGPAPPAASEPDPLMARGNGELILVVDDEEPMRRMTQRILEMFGYRAVLARNGAEAVSLYREQGSKIAAVITDMTMPVMDGPEAIRVLQSLNPDLPIIGASGLAVLHYAAQLANLGVTHILTKPYATAELLKMLQQVLQDSRAKSTAAA